MTYLQFLGQWYNLTWLAAVGVGLLLGLTARLARRGPPTGEAGAARPSVAPRPPKPRTSLAMVLVTAGVVGLTLNGAIHDLRLGSPEARFPLVTLLSLVVGWFVAWAGTRLRYRFAPPVMGLAFNRPGLEGGEAVVMSAGAALDGTVRARHRDGAGVVHIVRIRVPEGRDARDLGFGRKVRLGAFDSHRGSYDATIM